jgi:hypothetical protein
MDKIDCSHNKLVIFDTNVTKNIWLKWLNILKLLTWLKLLVDVALLISFSIKFYIIYMFIYNDIMY